MAQLHMKFHILILLATALVIPSSLCEVSDVYVESGSVAVLPCIVDSPNAHSTSVSWKYVPRNDGKMTTVWRRDKSGLAFRTTGQGARAHCPMPNFGKGDYSLHIEKAREEDGGVYICEVEGTRNMAFRTVMLHIVNVSFTPANVVEGRSLTVSCNITPKPKERIKIQWEQNGSRKNSQTQMLTIDRVSQKDAGTWSCLIQKQQTVGKASASLKVEGIVVPNNNNAVVYAELGSSVTLPCILSDGVVPISTHWKRVVTQDVGRQNELFLSSESSTLAVRMQSHMQRDMSAHTESVQEQDAGLYQCTAQVVGANGNRGTLERFIQLVIARVVKSSAKGRTTLTCQLSNASQVTHYEWLRWNYGPNGTQTLISIQNSTTNLLSISADEATGLREWVCRYYQQQTLLGNITYHLQIMSGLEGEKEPGSNKTAIVLGLLFLLMIVGLILLQIYKNHRRRKMVMQYPAMETIVHLAANERERRERSKMREKGMKATCGGDLNSECV